MLEKMNEKENLILLFVQSFYSDHEKAIYAALSGNLAQVCF